MLILEISQELVSTMKSFWHNYEVLTDKQHAKIIDQPILLGLPKVTDKQHAKRINQAILLSRPRVD